MATYNQNLVHELTALGNSVVAIAATHQNKTRLEYDGEIPVYRIPRPRISTRWDRRLPVFGSQMRFLRTLLYARKIRKILPVIVSKHKLDVLEYADIEAESFFHDKRYLPPYGVRLHGPLFSIEPYYRGKEKPHSTTLIKLMEKKAIVNATTITSPTQAIAEVVAAEYNIQTSRIQIIPHFFSADRCGWVKQHKSSNETRSLFVGRLEYIKGADIFAEAIPLVVQQFPDAQFFYLAHDRPRPDGSSMKEWLGQRFYAAGLLKNVHFVTAAEFDGCFYAALQPDICVIPSRFETFSFPSLEGMAHGTPVVASRTCGIPEVVEDGVSGLLFPVEDTKALANALCKLIANPDLRKEIGERGLERSTQHFHSRKIAEQIVLAYQKAIDSYERF